MKTTVTWKQDLLFECIDSRDNALILDGNRKQTSPMEAVLSGAAACSSIDVVDILKKGRFDLTACRCEITAERAPSPPQVFTHIHAHYYVSGNNLSEKAVKRAVDLSVDKYCSVMKMLEHSVEISTDFTIEPTSD